MILTFAIVIIVVLGIAITVSLKRMLFTPRSIPFVVNSLGHYTIPISLTSEGDCSATIVSSGPSSQSLLLKTHVIRIEQVRRVEKVDDKIVALFDPPTNCVTQPIYLTTSDVNRECVFNLLSNPSPHPPIDPFNFVLSNLFKSLPSMLTSVSPIVAFVNSTIASSNLLPSFIKSLNVSVIDISLFTPLISSIDRVTSQDYKTTSTDFKIAVTSHTPITVYFDGSVSPPLQRQQHSFHVKYMMNFSGDIRVKLLDPPCRSLYFSFDSTPSIVGDFALMSEAHWVKKYAFRSIMKVIQLTKNVLLEHFNYPNTTLIPL